MGVARVLAVLVGLGALAGCGGVQTRPTELVRVERSLELAEDFGAQEEPAAQRYLLLARENFRRAERWSRLGDSENARRWASRAQADADMAVLITREASVREAAQRSADEASFLSQLMSEEAPR
jgi:hypothetical protein